MMNEKRYVCAYCTRGDHHLCYGNRCTCEHSMKQVVEANLKYHGKRDE